MAVWRYLAHDLRTNERLGEIPLGNVRLTERLHGQQTLEATVDLAERSSPGRVIVPGDSGWLQFPGTVGNYASTPHAAELGITGDLTIGGRIRPDDWTPAANGVIVGKFVAVGSIAFYLILLTTGQLQLVWSTDGTAVSGANSTDDLSGQALDWLWVYATLDVDDGSSQNVTRFWTSTDGVTFTQLGADVTQAGATSIFNATDSPLEIGSVAAGAAANFAGDISDVSLRDGIGAGGTVGGTEVFRFDADTGLPPDTDPEIDSFDASTGQIITVHRSGDPHTEIVPTEPATAGATTPGRRLGGQYRDMLRKGRTKITPLRDGNPLPGSHIVWGDTYDGRGLRIEAAGIWSYYLGELGYELITDQTFTADDQFDIARMLLAITAQAQGNIGITLASGSSGVLRDRTYPGFEHQKIGKLVDDLANLEDGFDYAVTTALVNDLPVSTFRMFYPRRGRAWSENNITFTLGQNLRTFTRRETAPTTTLRALGAGEGTDMLVATANRVDLLTDGWPILTRSNSDHKDVTVQATLQAHANRHIRDVNDETAEWTLELVDPNDISTPYGAWVVGDDAKIVIPPDLDDYYPEGLEAILRIVGQTVEVPDDGGPERITLEMGPQWHA